MALHDQSYTPWEGAHESRFSRIWALVRMEFVRPFKNIWILILMIFTFSIVLAWLLLLMTIASQTGQMKASTETLVKMLDFVGNNTYRVWFYNTPGFSFLLTLLALSTGAGLIARDLRYNALAMYFSRAITRTDYMAAKFLTLTLYLLCMTLGPGLILFFGQYTMGMEELTTREYLQDLGAITLHSLILSIPLAAAILACSSITKHTYVACIFWAALFLASEIIPFPLAWLLRDDTVFLFSWSRLGAHLADFVYPVREIGGTLVRPNEPILETGWGAPFMILLAVTILSLGIVRWRLRSAEADE